jgi:hypothetical protein
LKRLPAGGTKNSCESGSRASPPALPHPTKPRHAGEGSSRLSFANLDSSLHDISIFDEESKSRNIFQSALIPARLISDSLFGIPKIEDFRFDALM